MQPTDQMSRPGCNPGQRPSRPQGGRFMPTLGPGAALVSVLRRCTLPAWIVGKGGFSEPTIHYFTSAANGGFFDPTLQ